MLLRIHTQNGQRKKHTHDDVKAFIDNDTMSVTVGAWGKKKMQALVWATTPLIFGICHCKGKQGLVVEML